MYSEVCLGYRWSNGKSSLTERTLDALALFSLPALSLMKQEAPLQRSKWGRFTYLHRPIDIRIDSEFPASMEEPALFPSGLVVELTWR